MVAAGGRLVVGLLRTLSRTAWAVRAGAGLRLRPYAKESAARRRQHHPRRRPCPRSNREREL